MADYNSYIGCTLGGRYKINSIVGMGGMAVVFAAWDTISRRKVAVKMLKEEMTADESSVKRFVGESRAVSMLAHHNIVTIYDVSIGTQTKYIVMEYIEGTTLKAYMNKKGALSCSEVLNYSAQILSALEHAHSKGIIHRDVKPQNIMMLPNGQLKVTDFGIAKMPDADTLTMKDKAIGTVYYISPEQAKGQKVDCRTDLYSLGILMFEMATGRLPFYNDNAISVAVKQLSEAPPSPRSINPNIPLGLEQIILCALEKNADNRFSSARDMLSCVFALTNNRELTFERSTSPGTALIPVQTYTPKPQHSGGQQHTAQQNPAGQHTSSSHTQQHSVQQRGSNTGSHAVRPSTGQHTAVQKQNTSSNRAAHTGNTSTGQRAKSGTGSTPTYRSNYKTDRQKKEAEKIKPKKQNRMMFPVIAGVTCAFLLVLLVTGIIIINKYMRSSVEKDPKTITVENYIDKIYDDELAAKIKSLNYYDIEVVEVYDNSGQKDSIIAQEPEYGEKRKVIPGIQKCSLKLTVCRGVQTVKLDDYTITEYRSAEAELRNKYSLIPIKKEEYSDTVKMGYVISTEPAKGEELKTGDSVVLTVSLGPKIDYVTVPKFTGMTEDKAYSSLIANSLSYGGVEYVYTGTTEYPDPVEAGTVIWQSKTPGTSVPANSTRISFKVSLGVMVDVDGVEQQP